MGRISTKKDKTVYQQSRESLGLSREKASELLEGISSDRIERIENEISIPHPDEVLIMSEKYKAPYLCNYYCSNQCPIGSEYVPEITITDFNRIILQLLSSLNAMHKKQERLIEIAGDGKVDIDEMDDFVAIQKDLEKISVTVEALQLWTEQMKAGGGFNSDHQK